MGIVAARGIRTGGSDAELRAVAADAVFLATRHRRTSYAVVAVGLVGLDDTRLVRSPDALRT